MSSSKSPSSASSKFAKEGCISAEAGAGAGAAGAAYPPPFPRSEEALLDSGNAEDRREASSEWDRACVTCARTFPER